MADRPDPQDDLVLTLSELCQAVRLPAERVMDLVESGVIHPQGRRPAEWRFTSVSVVRVSRAVRIQRDLGVNDPGAALALDLLEEIATLRRRLRRFEE